MKKYIVALSIMLALSAPTFAQHKPHHGECKPPDIVNMISDLSAAQKKKLQALSVESKKRIDQLRKEQEAVRDSIGYLISQKGNKTAVLFPLLDREAMLQAELSKECYSTRVKMDEVLTPAQREELHQQFMKQKPPHKKPGEMRKPHHQHK